MLTIKRLASCQANDHSIYHISTTDIFDATKTVTRIHMLNGLDQTQLANFKIQCVPNPSATCVV